MSKVYLIADLHLGHKNVVKWRSGFNSHEEHDELILGNLHATVKKRDFLYILGDVAFSEEALKELKKFTDRVTTHLILGNHDTEKRVPQDMLFSCFKSVSSLKSYKNTWLSHAPIHQDELRGKFNIHGHTHSHIIDDPRYLNVCAEQIEYKPIEFRVAREIIDAKNRLGT